MQIKRKLQSMVDVDTEAEASLLADAAVTVCFVYRKLRRQLAFFQIYGFDEELLKIKSFLFEQHNFSDQIKTVGIIGMRGVGKTTLAYFFVNYEAWKVFSPIIWVTLSDKMNPSKIVRRLLKTLRDNDSDYDNDIQAINDDDNDNDNDDELSVQLQLRELHDRLLGKKYLMVLDGVWHVSEWYSDLGSVSSDHPICFRNLSDGLPKGCGGAVIVTGSEDVAISMVGEKNLVRLEPTFDAEALWSIFMDSVRRKTFLTSDHHQRLSRMKDEIIDRCDGLPFAAKSLAEIISLRLANKEHWSDSSVLKRFQLRFNQPYDEDITELVERLPGVDEVVHGSDCDEIAVTGTCNPVAIARELGKFWQVELTSVIATHQALKGINFITKTAGSAGWAMVEKRFNQLTASTDGLLPRRHFCECIGMNRESREFAGELFHSLARKRNIVGDSINKAQLKDFWDQISDQSFDSRLQTFFNMVDKDGNGIISEEEVREIIMLSASTNRLTNIMKQADEYAALVMGELDPENRGYIMREDLEILLLQSPNHSTGGGESGNLSQIMPTQEKNLLTRWHRNLKYFLQDNWQRAWVIALWIGIMLGLFAYKFVQYRNEAAYEVMGHCVCMAKGAAETLKLNMALCLLPVCRNTITWLRNKTKLGIAVPFNDNLNFHKIIAVAIVIGVGIHGVYHLACDFPRVLDLHHEKYDELMKQYFGEVQPSSYWFFVKGVEVVTGIVMVVFMAIAFTLSSSWFRRGRLNLPKPLKKFVGFNAFWYSHHLFVIVYTLLIVHGIKIYLIHEWYKKTTWMYLAVPMTLYAGERFIRAFRSTTKPVKILKALVYPGNVLVLHISKPQGFKYKSGQYMFVNCAAVSRFEWHPFAITSAPGDEYLSIHIRTLGDWTLQLKIAFSEVLQPPPSGKSGLLVSNCSQGENNRDFPRVLIDGPYEGSTQDYKEYEVVLLVGLGIGATPMISIVKDIVNNINAMEEEENALENGVAGGGNNTTPISSSPMTQKQKFGSAGSGGSNFKTRRAYFYWITREQGSFDWFKEVMNEVPKMDPKGVIEMHNYCTTIYEENDARSTFIAKIQSLIHAKNGVDVISGTCVKSHFARPNWYSVYERIAHNHAHATVGVFYCGAPALGKEIRKLASYFSHTTSTKFEFHKENF